MGHPMLFAASSNSSDQKTLPTHSGQADLFGTGIGLMIASTILTFFQAQLVSILEHITSAQAEVVVDSDDDAYSYLAEYLASNPQLVKQHYTNLESIVGYIKHLAFAPFYFVSLMLLFRSTHKIRQCIRKEKLADLLAIQKPQNVKSVKCKTTYEDSEDTKKPTVFYVPNDGNYSISFKSSTIHFSITTSQTKLSTSFPNIYHEKKRSETITSGSKTTSIVLRSYSHSTKTGSRDIQDLIQTSIDAFYSKNSGKTTVFALAGRWGDFEFKRFISRPTRPMDSIILNPDIKNSLIKDVEMFLKSEDWYQLMGIPYRRGYILHGPPGTGKSSFIFSLAGYLKMDLSIANLTLPSLTDSSLASSLSDAPPNSILVFEDIDVAMGKKKKPDTGTNNQDFGEMSQVTLSGLLNALDGLIAQEGRIVFMTTNNIQDLPDALLRPGRVDRRFLFQNATFDVAVSLFVRFYGKTLGEAEAFGVGATVAKLLGIPEKDYGIAQLQGFYSRYRDAPAKIVDHVQEFLKELEEQKVTQEMENKEEEKKSDKKGI
ncbi:UNVERIFIED_CONTAM: hypothetical protein HDU68_010840 [Siphonaria sp. JEL0065]|nr:hypothetical protein HDU68_010840 [Siphonaria sp. JEL0065]